MEIKSYKEKYKYINKLTRALFFLFGDTFSLVLSAIMAYITLLPLISAPRPFPVQQTTVIAASVLIGLAVFRMYLVNWRYTGIRDLVRIIFGIFGGSVIAMGLSQILLTPGNYEYAFTALVTINAVVLIGGFRISKRLYCEFVHAPKRKRKHTIIYGAESEGEQILRDIQKNEHWNLSVYGMFDDRVMPDLLLHGVRILGGKEKMIDHVRTYPVDLLIVAFPEIAKRELREMLDAVKKIRPEMDIKVLPSFHSLTEDPVGLKHIRDISIDDILGREPVKIDMKSIEASIAGKTVMVTGAGGSIGSELVRQCANLKPSRLVALDIDETELFHIENEFKESPTNVIPCVASITDESKMSQMIGYYKPDVIFHAAAYKHVPMMESYPDEAIKVNIGGTRILASLACEYRVDKFVMISTDKAVNPTNVMGASKRVAEEICMAFNGTSNTRFMSVRFGNVLGSRGSVVPLFIDQIKKGGPVTVTDPEMKRYFMTIPEAVLLVMQAGSLGKGGEVFVLDMGEPVKILDMAQDLIRLHNLEPGEDIAITFTGCRPGEKLFEELLNAEEGVTETEHEEIFKAVCSSQLTLDELNAKIGQLFNLIKSDNSDAVRYLLKTIVPTYSYKEHQKVGYLNGKSNHSVMVG